MDDPWHRRETDGGGRISNTFELSGRKRGSWSQQRCVSDHRSPVKLGCVGRSGRCPWIIESMAIADGLSLNGTSPVKIYSNPKVSGVKLSMKRTGCGIAYLDHDHSEGKHVTFLGVFLINHDLWRSPPYSVTVLVWSALYGVRIFSDHCKSEVRDTCVTRAIHKDICLTVREHNDETKVMAIAYSFEVSMYHVTRMEVAEALSDISQLGRRLA